MIALLWRCLVLSRLVVLHWNSSVFWIVLMPYYNCRHLWTQCSHSPLFPRCVLYHSCCILLFCTNRSRHSVLHDKDNAGTPTNTCADICSVYNVLLHDQLAGTVWCIESPFFSYCLSHSVPSINYHQKLYRTVQSHSCTSFCSAAQCCVLQLSYRTICSCRVALHGSGQFYVHRAGCLGIRMRLVFSRWDTKL